MNLLFNKKDKATLSDLIEKAVDNDNDWSTILDICDFLNDDIIRHKTFIQMIKAIIKADNQRKAINSIQILDSASKNCGWALHKEISTEEFMKFITDIIDKDNRPLVTEKIVAILNFWGHHLKEVEGFQFIKNAMEVAKKNGHKMDDLTTSEAMIEADVLPQWKEGDSCILCETKFTILTRKHHCRACGALVCGKCSVNSAILPKFSVETPVRVCDACYNHMNENEKATNVENVQETVEDPEFLAQLNQALQESAELEKKKLKQSDILERYRNFGSNSASETKKEEHEDKGDHVDAVSASAPEVTSIYNEPTSTFVASNFSQPIIENPGEVTEDQPSEDAEYVPGQLTTGDFASKEFLDTFRGNMQAFSLRLQSSIQRKRPVSTDTGLHNSFKALCDMYQSLKDIIGEAYESRGYYETLQDKMTKINDAMEALNVMKDEYYERMVEERRMAEMKRREAMKDKLDWLRQCKSEYYEYQRYMQMQLLGGSVPQNDVPNPQMEYTNEKFDPYVARPNPQQQPVNPHIYNIPDKTYPYVPRMEYHPQYNQVQVPRDVNEYNNLYHPTKPSVHGHFDMNDPRLGDGGIPRGEFHEPPKMGFSPNNQPYSQNYNANQFTNYPGVNLPTAEGANVPTCKPWQELSGVYSGFQRPMNPGPHQPGQYNMENINSYLFNPGLPPQFMRPQVPPQSNKNVAAQSEGDGAKSEDLTTAENKEVDRLLISFD